MAGNETLAAIRQRLITNATLNTFTGGRIYQPKFPADLADWPSIVCEEVLAESRPEPRPWREDVVQVSVYGEPEGIDRPDISQTLRQLAAVVAQFMLWQDTAIALAQPRIMAVSGARILPDWDPDTHQPVQRVLLTLQIHEETAAVLA